MKVYNGKDLILGRLATVVAKQALLGEEVKVVNCEKIMISGRKTNTVAMEKPSRTIPNQPRAIRIQSRIRQNGPRPIRNQSRTILKRSRTIQNHPEPYQTNPEPYAFNPELDEMGQDLNETNPELY